MAGVEVGDSRLLRGVEERRQEVRHDGVGCSEAAAGIIMDDYVDAVVTKQVVALRISRCPVLAMERFAIDFEDAPVSLPTDEEVDLAAVARTGGTQSRERTTQEEHARPIKRLRKVAFPL